MVTRKDVARVAAQAAYNAVLKLGQTTYGPKDFELDTIKGDIPTPTYGPEAFQLDTITPSNQQMAYQAGATNNALIQAAQQLVRQAQDPQSLVLARKILANAYAVSSKGDFQGTYSNAFFRDMGQLDSLGGVDTTQFAAALADFYGGADQASYAPQIKMPEAYSSKNIHNLLKVASYIQRKYFPTQ